MSTTITHQIKQCRPDAKETDYFWKLFHAAQRNDSRWFGSSLSTIAYELNGTQLERQEKLFLLRAWQVLVDDKGGFGRFMGAFDTYVFNMQDPNDDCCAWKPELAQLLNDGGLFGVMLEAYQEAQLRISELQSRAESAEQALLLESKKVNDALYHGYDAGHSRGMTCGKLYGDDSQMRLHRREIAKEFAALQIQEGER